MRATKPVACLGLLLVLSWTARAADDDPLGIGSKGVLSAQATLASKEKIVPGGEVTLKVKIDIKPGWHVYANPAGLENLKPTVVALPADSKAKLLDVDYPDGTEFPQPDSPDRALVYEESADLAVKLRLPVDAKPGRLEIPLQVRFQACNDSTCLAPATLNLPVKLTVEGR